MGGPTELARVRVKYVAALRAWKALDRRVREVARAVPGSGKDQAVVVGLNELKDWVKLTSERDAAALRLRWVEDEYMAKQASG